MVDLQLDFSESPFYNRKYMNINTYSAASSSCDFAYRRSLQRKAVPKLPLPSFETTWYLFARILCSFDFLREVDIVSFITNN